MTAPLIWVLADERRGTANQALGVAQALGLPFEVKEVAHGPLSRLPNALLGASRRGMTGQTAAQLTPPWPDLVIAAGRRAGAPARWIKRQNRQKGGGRTVLVQIMYPGDHGAGEFDLIAVPRHDSKTGTNLFQMMGAPHGVGEAARIAARADWEDRFAAFAHPVIGLVLGGATRRRPFRPEEAHRLGLDAGRATLSAGGSLVVTSSPRTGPALDGALAGIAEAGLTPALVHRWGMGDDNPYLAFLALADALIVTGDSVSMLSEACSGTQPVYLYAPPGFVTAKHARLHSDLIASGYVRRFEGRIDPWTHPALNSARDVAAEIRRRLESIFRAH